MPDSGGDTTTATGCGALGEGQSRCIDANSMEICQSNSLSIIPCQDGLCSGGVCAESVQFVRIVDVTNAINGQHPGADIDAIALQSGGQTVYATRVTDWFIPDVASQATTVTELLGQPDMGPNACDLSDGAEHWISLAGGEVVVTFDRPILSGDRITVYECAGAAQDAFDVTVGASSRLEGDWQVLLEEATGTVGVTVP